MWRVVFGQVRAILYLVVMVTKIWNFIKAPSQKKKKCIAHKGKLKFNSEYLILKDIYTCGPLIPKETTALTQTMNIDFILLLRLQKEKKQNNIWGELKIIYFILACTKQKFFHRFIPIAIPIDKM